MFASGGCSKGAGGFPAFAAAPLLRHLAKLSGACGESACGPGELLSGLDLNDEQVEKIAEIKGKAFGKCAHAKIDLMELKKGLFKELGAAQIDRNKVLAIGEQIKDQKSALTDLMLDHIVQFAEVLTPEQRRKIRINKIRSFLGFEEPEGGEE